ncbi:MULTISPECIES: Asp23/Gls24 family envelope stress response protein [Streptomyces]|uniref:Asp23/Gls24 family envelope stress response protein n=1 Tax=Streptomyces TaxID=1883 RepID=UPI001E568808|nr:MULTISPECIES: Asp23/Gls24 family envelope stress response protein [Streptomyces]UFQ13779.1 Asp23/Gls24 family envelope stress response protein [Streptomyces huasconensis]WCL83374.1 Asp23/Gls24 family envelope stress response protein [Streptomyces sp. JCM 35825]
MTEQRATGDLTDTVARAVLDTAGVAFLRPGLAQLLRTSGPLARVRAGGTGRPSHSSGVRVTRLGGTGRWHVEVHLVLHRGRRAVDVTRAVRAAVTEALRGEVGSPPRVSVTVTGLV